MTQSKWKQLSIMFPPEMVAAIDEARGDVPRVTWVRHACQRRLDFPTYPGQSLPEVRPAKVAPTTCAHKNTRAHQTFGKVCEDCGKPKSAW